jgi:hypothetical protein
MCRDNSDTPKEYTHIATGKTIGRTRLKHRHAHTTYDIHPIHNTHIPGIQQLDGTKLSGGDHTMGKGDSPDTEECIPELYTRSIHFPPASDGTFSIRQQGVVLSARSVSTTVG